MSSPLDRLVEKKSGPLVAKIDELIREQRKTNNLLEKSNKLHARTNKLLDEILVVLKNTN